MELYEAALNLLNVSTLVYITLLVLCVLLLTLCGVRVFGTLALQIEPQYLHSLGDPFQETSIYVRALHFYTALSVMSRSVEVLRRR